jgi:hypothetical protein
MVVVVMGIESFKSLEDFLGIHGLHMAIASPIFTIALKPAESGHHPGPGPAGVLGRYAISPSYMAQGQSPRRRRCVQGQLCKREEGPLDLCRTPTQKQRTTIITYIK